jgi:glutamyl-tRNA reductase
VTLICLGTDFRATPLNTLATLELAAAQIQAELYQRVEEFGEGVVVLATCNRFEIYLQARQQEAVTEALLDVIAQTTNLTLDRLREIFEQKSDLEAVRHLFAVTSGLQSMVIGESEIAGQVRLALAEAATKTRIPSELGQLFGSALRLTKQVNQDSGLRAVSRSVVTSALELIDSDLSTLSSHRVVLIGTGSFARVVSKTLKNHGTTDIGVYSRSGRAREFSSRYGYSAIAPEDLVANLAEADLVISVSGGPGFVIDQATARAALSLRTKSEPLKLLDLALSKDVDPAVSEIAGIEVRDLESVKSDLGPEDVAAIARAEKLVLEAVAEFQADALIREVDPLIVALRSKIDSWVMLETEEIRKREGDQAAERVQRSLRKVTRAIMHEPSVKGKELARQGQHSEYARAMSMLFDLEARHDQ